MTRLPLALAIAATAALAVPAHAGQPAAKGNIVATAMSSPDHSTLVAAVKAAGLVDTLAGGGSFTVFAPTDSAFAKLPAGTVQNLLQPANRAMLKAVLTYHVVAGKVGSAELVQAIRAGGGSAVLTTVEGSPLTASLDGNGVILRDERGGIARVVAADLKSRNGILHVTDAVSLPQ